MDLTGCHIGPHHGVSLEQQGFQGILMNALKDMDEKGA